MALPAADFSRPVVGDLFGGQPGGIDWPGFVQANVQAALTLLETDGTNKPVGAKRISGGVFQRWDGAAWQAQPLAYLGTDGGALTGPLGFPAGTPGAPGLYVAGDQNNGLFSPNVDVLALATAGVERWRANASGQMIVGPSGTSPQYGSRLRVEGGIESIGAAQFNAAPAGGAAFEIVNQSGGGLKLLPTATLTAVTVDAAGNAGFGGVPNAYGAGVNVLTVNASATPAIDLNVNGVRTGSFLVNATSVSLLSLGAANLPIVFGTAGSERMRIDTSGNVGIGVTPSQRLHVAKAGDVYFQLTDTATGCNVYVGAQGGNALYGTDRGAGATLFLAGGAERMRIDPGGRVVLNDVSAGVNYRLAVNHDGGGMNGLEIRDTGSAGAPNMLNLWMTAKAPNNGNAVMNFSDSAATRFSLKANGGINNYSGNNSNLSDRRLKEGLEPATPYLAKMRAVPIYTYLYEDQPDKEPTLGTTAQELHAIAPELVDTHAAPKLVNGEPRWEDPYWGIYENDFHYAVLKALQELADIVDTLRPPPAPASH